jgi:hypothetical protein
VNIFSLLLGLGFLGSAILGSVCLIIFAVKRMWKAVLWTVGGTFACCGILFGLLCLMGSAADLRLHRLVAPAEAVGNWDLSEYSVAMTTKDSGLGPYHPAKDAVHRLEIHADGSCRYRSLFPWPKAHYVDCTGTWKVRPDTITKNVSQLELSLEIDRGYGMALEFGEKDGRLFIWEYWGDPDSGEILRYNRLEN